MLKAAFLVSGGGTNMQAVMDGIREGRLDCRIVQVISSRKDAYALERARMAGVPGAAVIEKEYESREAYVNGLIKRLEDAGTELVVTAGYLKVLDKKIVERYRNRIINVHPALIPSFCGKGYYGLRVHEAVLAAGVKVTGATVHFVDEGTDTGPIILQKAVPVLAGDTPEILQKRVMEKAEWVLLPEAINLFSQDKLVINGNIVTIREEHQ